LEKIIGHTKKLILTGARKGNYIFKEKNLKKKIGGSIKSQKTDIEKIKIMQY
jgi:hypothetical protein